MWKKGRRKGRKEACINSWMEGRSVRIVGAWTRVCCCFQAVVEDVVRSRKSVVRDKVRD